HGAVPLAAAGQARAAARHGGHGVLLFAAAVVAFAGFIARATEAAKAARIGEVAFLEQGATGAARAVAVAFAVAFGAVGVGAAAPGHGAGIVVGHGGGCRPLAVDHAVEHGEGGVELAVEGVDVLAVGHGAALAGVGLAAGFLVG